MGITRFLANSLFYGTQGIADQDMLYQKMDDLGISARTEVSAEYTFYNFSILPEVLDESLQLFGEVLTKPLLAEQNVTKEAQITMAEINRRGLNVQQQIFDKVNEMIFEGHPLGFFSMGKPDTVKAVTRQDLLDYYQKHYVSGNCLLVASVPQFNLKDALEKSFGQMAQGQRQTFTPFDFNKVSPRAESINAPGKVGQFVLSWLCYPRGAQERTAQALLNAVLSYGRSNPYLGQLRKDKVVYSASSLINLYSDCGVFSILGSAENYRVKQAQDQILGILEGLKTQAVSEEILKRAKNLYKSRLATLMESSLESSLFYATRVFFNVDETSIDDLFTQIDKVTPADIQKTAQTIFYPNGMFSVTAGSGF